MDRPVLATGLAATSFVSFRVAALTEGAYLALMEIPGCQPWWRRRTEILAPYTVAAVVGEELARLGVAFDVTVPPCAWVDRGPEEEGVILARSVAGGLQPWTLDAFMMPWQRRAVRWACSAGRGLLVAQPGAGKTLVAAAWLAEGVGSVGGGAQPHHSNLALYVCPTAAVRQVVRELERFTDLRVVPVVGASSRRKRDTDPLEALDQPGFLVLVIGWELLAPWAKENRERLDPSLVVFDESDMAKNGKRIQWSIAADGKGLDKIALESRSATASVLARSASRVLCMTGTPVADNLRDMWGQMTLVEPDGWGQTDKRFLVRYCDAQPGQYGGLVVPKDAASPYLPELRRRLAWGVHEVTYEESHGHLPPKRRVMLRVSIEDQRAEVTGYARELNKTQDEDRKIFLRLALAASRKRAFAVRALPDYLSAGKGKMIVFTGLRKDADAWAEAFAGVKVRGAPLKAWASHGDATASERDEVLQEYMAHPGPCVLCVTWQAWGVALNLDDTDVIVFAMLPFRPRDIAQAEGRGDRASMTRPLLYVYLIGEGTADEGVIDLILAKLEAVRAVSPGTRLDAFGGVRATLVGAEDIGELQAQMLQRLAEDIYADAEG